MGAVVEDLSGRVSLMANGVSQLVLQAISTPSLRISLSQLGNHSDEED